MVKPKGGRGKVAPYKSTHVRVPEPIKEQIQRLIDEWHEKQGSTQDDENLLTGINNLLTDYDTVVEMAREIVKKKKSAKVSLQLLIKELFGRDVEL
jgi:nitrate/nitrite-specific signal transduction histidine kinase